MSRVKIYYFWEPEDSMPGYLRLCLRTWEKAFSGMDIVPLNYRTAPALLGNDDWLGDNFLSLPLNAQKDALIPGVLFRHGGLFLDVDTIATGPPQALLAALQRHEVVQFGAHLGAVAARPGARLLALWGACQARRLQALALPGMRGDEVPWHFMANAPLQEALDELAGLPPMRIASDRPLTAAAFASIPRRRIPARLWRRLSLALQRRRYRSFDREQYGFILEANHPVGDTAQARYTDFWWSRSLPVEATLGRSSAVIGLHHSWTPNAYCQLSEREVLEHPSLLSRTLRALL